MTDSHEEVVQLPVRTEWPDEASDFTPWLAKNLDLWGDELGVRLELVQQEMPVGPFSLDILARDADTGMKVAIENQLEETDHIHLGQLLTYASGCGVGIAVWVAPEFGYEHAQALDQLNKWTGDAIRFYGVKIEVIKKATDSSIEHKFHKVVYPGGWNRELSRNSLEMPLTTRRYYDFFQPLITGLSHIGFADKITNRFGRTVRLFRSCRNEGIGYEASLLTWNKQNAAWVVLHIETEDKELTKRIFDELQTDREAIESSIDPGPGAQWEWLRFNGAAFSQIGVSRPGSIDDPQDKLEETRAWMLDLLPKLKEVFEPRLNKLLT